MNGDVWELLGAGYRLVDGEIQVIADNDAAVTGADLSATSALWQAVDGTGALVAPGTAGTMKFNASNADGSGVAILDNVVTNQSDGTTYTSNTFESTTVDGINVLAAPDRLKQLGIFPADAGLGGDGLWMRNLGKRFPMRGGNWYTSGTAGIFAVNLFYPRSFAYTGIGFRPAFIGNSSVWKNEVLYSNDLTNSTWLQSGTLTPTLVSGLDATHSATKITDDNAVNDEYIHQEVVLTAPLSPMVVRIFIKKQTSATANCQLYFSFQSGGLTEVNSISVNAQAGTIIKDGDDTGTLAHKIIESVYDADSWEILISATPGDAANTTYSVVIDPAWYNLDTIVGDATNTGSVTVGNVELYQNVTIAYIEGTDPVFTTS